MKFSSNKAKLTATITLVLLMASVTLVTLVPVKAQVVYTNLQEGGSVPLPAGVTPDVTMDTVASLSFRPNPVGVGQTILVNMWVTPSVHVSRYQRGYTVTFTKPDGTKDVIGPIDSYRADSTAWFEYVVDQVGTWKLKFDYPGGYFPPGNYTIYPGAFGGSGVTNFPQSAYYKPSSSGELTLTVQQDIVYSWPESALPTDYWTRPAHVENREWWPILGNWPATGYVGGGSMWDELYPDTSTYWNARHKFTPWVQGPNSAHIVWKRQGALSGLIGGQAQTYGTTGGPGNPSIIYSGRCYQTVTKQIPTLINGTYILWPTSVWECYDLRTGEVYWDIQGVSAPTLIEYASPTQSEVPGAVAAGTWSVSLMYIGGGRLIKYSPWTGAATTNVSISPLTTGTFYAQSSGRGGDPMCLTVQNIGNTTNPNYRLINWTTRGSSSNFTSRIQSNTTYARSSLPTLIDFEAGLGATVSGITQAGVYTGMNLTGYRLWTGETLWSKNISEPVYSGSCDIVDHGKLAVLSDRGYYVATDLWTGNLAWTSEKMDYPWAAAGFGAYSAMSAYGMLYRESMSGVYAFNWTNGKIVWKYEAPAKSQYENPFTGKEGDTVYPFYSFGVGGIIADGKFYTWTYEHTESWPVTRGWGLHCINITTGKGIWNITGCMNPGAVADGYVTASNSYDGYMYVFGKGKSATTVTASPKTIARGADVLIEGTVLDQSPAQPGTPCVSKESMTTQMEYLHMQLPIDGIWHNVMMTGVPVTLTAMDSNGNVINIGTTTTNAYYGTFSHAWTPPNEDTYTIMASFAADDSYSSSSAATAVSVGPAPATPTPTPEPVQAAPDNMPLVYATAAIIIAIVIVGMLIILALRKRQ